MCWRLKRKKCQLGGIRGTIEEAAKGVDIWRKKDILPWRKSKQGRWYRAEWNQGMSCEKSTSGSYVGVVDESGKAGWSKTAEAYEAGGDWIYLESNKGRSSPTYGGTGGKWNSRKGEKGFQKSTSCFLSDSVILGQRERNYEHVLGFQTYFCKGV